MPSREVEARRGAIGPYIMLGQRVQKLHIDNLLTKTPNKVVAGRVFSIGHSVAVSDKVSKLRTEIGLLRLPPTVLTYKKRLNEVKKIMEETGLDRRIIVE